MKELSEDFKFTNNEQDKAKMRGARDITTKSGEKVVFGWSGNGSQNNYFDQWKVGSEKKDGKKKEIQNANDSPSFPMLELSSSGKRASEARRAMESKPAKSKGKEAGASQQTGVGEPDHNRPGGLYLLANNACQAEEVNEREKSVTALATTETKVNVLKKSREKANASAVRRKARKKGDREMEVETAEQEQLGEGEDVEEVGSGSESEGRLGIEDFEESGDDGEEEQEQDNERAANPAEGPGEVGDLQSNQEKDSESSERGAAQKNQGKADGPKETVAKAGGTKKRHEPPADRAVKKLFADSAKGKGRRGKGFERAVIGANEEEGMEEEVPDEEKAGWLVVKVNKYKARERDSESDVAGEEVSSEDQSEEADSPNTKARNKKAAVLKECADVAKAFDCFDEKLREECYANYSIKNPDCEEEEREEVRASLSNEMRERLREANGGGSLLLAGSDILSINNIEEILKGKKT